MQYTETELNKLIETVEKEFSAVLTKAEETTLAKSEIVASAAPLVKAEDESSENEDEKSEDKKDEDKADDKKEAAPAEEKPEFESKDQQAAPQAEAAPQEEGHGYDDEDMEHMRKMYSSMSKSELKAHHDAIAEIAKCGEASQGTMPKAELAKSEPKSHEEADGGQISANEPKNSPGAKSPASKAEGMQMEKSENTEFDLVKSELDAVKAEKDALKKNFDAVQEFLTKLVKKVPQGKAITSLEQIAKSEDVSETKELSKSEVTQILTQKASDPTLSKSDREAINAFYLGGANFNTISHLLNK